MSEEKIRFPIHSALIPVFYQNFRCLAQDCRDSCCVGWRITFDKKDYLRLRRLEAPAELKERLEKDVRRERKGANGGVFYGKFDLESHNGRCPFLNEEGLCSIQLACGGEALPYVCRSYPRNVFYTTAAREYTLSTSCEGVLQQLWELPEGVEFVEDPLPKAEQKMASVVKGENLTRYFAPLRAMCVDILQDRSLLLAERMLYLGITLQRLMAEDWESLDADEWIGRAASPAAALAGGALELPGNRNMYLAQNAKVLDVASAQERSWAAGIYDALGAERETILTAREDGVVQEIEKKVYCSQKAYDEALEEFEAAFGERAYFFENVMVAVALYLGFPHLGSREALWKSYVSLCSLYSFFRFVSVLGCKGEATKERLFHMIVMASRATLHNQERLNGFQEELFQHESSTLAHMAILLRG